MGGIDKFLNSAERKGIITIIKHVPKKKIIIDTEYFLKTGIKKELKDKIKKPRKKYYKTITKDEWDIRKKNTIQRNNLKSSLYYYKNKEKIKLQRKQRYLKDKEKETKRYYDNKEYFINRSSVNYYIRKDKKKTRQYFKNNIIPYIIDATFKKQSKVKKV